MTEPAPFDRKQRILRLERKGDRYREVTEGSRVGGEATLDGGVACYLHDSCYRLDAEIEVDGATVNGPVYVSRSRPDVAYALIDPSLVGALRSGATAGLAGGFDAHIHELRRAVSRYDSLGEGESRDLRNTYVRPRLVLRQPDGDTQAFAWERLPTAQHAVIFGTAGAGKTSLLRRLALAATDSLVASPETGTVPLYLQLRQLTGRALDAASLRRHISATGGPQLAGRFDELARSGRLLLLLDGLDEVVDTNRAALARSVGQLRDLHPSLRILVTSRLIGYGGELDDFARVEILPFNREQIQEWVWLSQPDEDSWHVFLRHLSENVDIEAAVANPLLLSLAYLLFEGSAVAPEQRSVLFGYFVRALIDEWDRDRGVHRTLRRANNRAIYTNLCRFSYMCVSEDLQTFGVADVERWSSSARRGRRGTGVDVEALAETSALLSKVGEGRWAFIHLDFRNFLAAEYVVASSGEATGYLSDRLSGTDGRAVWALASGSALDATPLLRLALESELLAPEESAGLLIDALKQGVEADDAIVRQCVERIVGVVEAKMPYVGAERLIPDTSSNVHLFELRCHAAPLQSDVMSLANAIEALASARDAEWAPVLFERLSSSSVGEVRALALVLISDLPRGAWIRAIARNNAITVSAEAPTLPATGVRRLVERMKSRLGDG